MALPEQFEPDEFVSRILAEDLGKNGDVTSRATIGEDARFTAEMNARQAIVVAGLEIASAFFSRLDPHVRIEQLAKDGEAVDPRSTLMRMEGNARAMLTRCFSPTLSLTPRSPTREL